MTTTFDASPLTALPTSLPTLPTGTYALPISAPFAVQNSCLVNTAQSSAWSCTVPMTSYLITITEIEGATSNLDNNEINLTQGNNTFGGYYPYGSQPPLLTQTEVLNLVTDSQDPARGPAWFFELPYNKIVIVPEELLSAPSTKRDFYERDPQTQAPSSSDFTRKTVAEAGDRPWFCYWNGTLLEAFIYVNLSSAAATQASAVSSTTNPAGTSQPGDSYNKGQFSTITYDSSVPTSNVQSPSSPSSGPSQQLPPEPLAYPKVLKIEERRIPRGGQSVPPYCKPSHEFCVPCRIMLIESF